MQDILIQIDQLVSELKSLQPVKDEYQKKLDKKFRLEFNYNSNHIEGNTLTYGNTELLLIFDKISGDYDAREIEEMKAHDVALAMIKELATDKERDLTESFIRQLNELILVRPFWKEALTADGQPTRRLIEPGNYKKYSNSVRLQNGEMFDYASPEETPAMMGELMEFYKSNADKHPLWQAAMMHYKFVRIHPFDDGNGRVARLLMNYIILKHDLPPVIIKSSDKKGYLTALNKADSGDVDSFIRYIAQQEVWSLDISIKAARGENIEDVGDIDKEIELLKRNKGSISKSPKVIFDTYPNIEKNWWNKLHHSLGAFNELFTETKVERFVNGYIEKKDTSTGEVIKIITKITQEAEQEIFGYGIYRNNIDYLKWSEKKYGLRGASHVTDFEINLQVDFKVSDYAIKVLIGKINIYEIKIGYSSQGLDSDVNEMITKAKRYLTDSIQAAVK